MRGVLISCVVTEPCESADIQVCVEFSADRGACGALSCGHTAARTLEQRRVLLMLRSSFASPCAWQVIPPGQPSWADQEYQGSFTCRIWQFGRWVEVTTDDRLPCLAGRLCFSRCQREDVFWLPLLEKVYAKCVCWGLRAWPGASRGAATTMGCPGSVSAHSGLQSPLLF